MANLITFEEAFEHAKAIANERGEKIIRFNHCGKDYASQLVDYGNETTLWCMPKLFYMDESESSHKNKMTHQEKAYDLVDKYKSLIISAEGCNEGSNPCITSSKMFTISAIECAIINVNEIMEDCDTSNVYDADRFYYWNQVRKELEKLKQPPVSVPHIPIKGDGFKKNFL